MKSMNQLKILYYIFPFIPRNRHADNASNQRRAWHNCSQGTQNTDISQLSYVCEEV